MSANNGKTLVGRMGFWRVPVRARKATCVLVRVKVIQVRDGYGRRELLIQPVHGRGRTWVQRKAFIAK